MTAARTQHAVSVEGRLVCQVTCWPSRQIVVTLLRPDEQGHPHATYHVDGTRAVRSRLGTETTTGPGGKYLTQGGLSRLDAPVSVPVNVFAFTVRWEDSQAATQTWGRGYSSTVDIPAGAFDRGYVIVSIDIVKPGVASPAQESCERFMENDLPGTRPRIRVTVWRPPHAG